MWNLKTTTSPPTSVPAHAHCAQVQEQTGAGQTLPDNIHPPHRVGRDATGNTVAVAVDVSGRPLDHYHVVMNEQCGHAHAAGGQPAKPCNCGK